jgi:DNA repair protein RadC
MALTGNKSVKDWPEDEKPRERLIAYGPSTLSEAQLLAILTWNSKAGRTAGKLGRKLLERFGSLAGIEQASITEMCGPAKAAEIKAAIELGQSNIADRG